MDPTCITRIRNELAMIINFSKQNNPNHSLMLSKTSMAIVKTDNNEFVGLLMGLRSSGLYTQIRNINITDVSNTTIDIIGLRTVLASAISLIANINFSQTAIDLSNMVAAAQPLELVMIAKQIQNSFNRIEQIIAESVPVNYIQACV